MWFTREESGRGKVLLRKLFFLKIKPNPKKYHHQSIKIEQHCYFQFHYSNYTLMHKISVHKSLPHMQLILFSGVNFADILYSLFNSDEALGNYWITRKDEYISRQVVRIWVDFATYG